MHKYKFSYPYFYSDIGYIIVNMEVEANDDYLSYIVKELLS